MYVRWTKKKKASKNKIFILINHSGQWTVRNDRYVHTPSQTYFEVLQHLFQDLERNRRASDLGSWRTESHVHIYTSMFMDIDREITVFNKNNKNEHDVAHVRVT